MKGYWALSAGQLLDQFEPGVILFLSFVLKRSERTKCMDDGT